ncbi:cytochrome P450 [Methylobacterium sp. Leaf108]|uniref:cytochrome P450 n=1 Tax=Methylobacterium sp. Leaf108 TaxID=1736256 RepID=UPI0006F57399|nr:cytochrome P450 [Methylobacterium sp. Leaf108]KQP50910.1 cytochrome [Methylobacterium sp. Leaf108]
MADPTLFAQIKDPANRADPYPLYARLRGHPVLRQDDDSYLVSSHAAIRALLFDPRISSADLPPAHSPATGNPFKDWILRPIKDEIVTRHRPLIFRDPPDHDALRRIVMTQFTPERVHGMKARTQSLVDELLDRRRGGDAICVVEDLAYPLPVTVICEMLGVPPEDEPTFQGWATQLATALEPDARHDEETQKQTRTTFDAISAYMKDLIKEKRARPVDDMLSGLAAETPAGRMGDFDLIATAILLLVAGHETTVNLIANGMLTLLRHPDELERLRRDPERAPRLIEECLRYEPPVHFRTRKALCDIPVAGTVIPEGAAVALLFAAANRDPDRFTDPDRFDPDRADNQHFGFGGSLHYCLGAPLARIEAEIALVTLARRLKAPRLLDDPPPYRDGASLRGPKTLRVAIDGLV